MSDSPRQAKQIVVISGKGGTGKTSVVAALAHLASQRSRLVLVDADVDAANLGLVLAPLMRESHDFYGGQIAVIAADRCTGCGACSAACRFEAIAAHNSAYEVDPIACEGCASCYYRCPEQAISMKEQLAGYWYVSDTRFGPLVHAHLLAGQENSGKLVTQTRQVARELAQAEGADYILIDGPPGIGCPVIAATSGVDLGLVVAEPTIAGAHDLERALATASHFGVPAVVCINKCDLNAKRADEIERFCREQGVVVVGRIPFDPAVTEAMVKGRAITERSDGGVARELIGVWASVEERLSGAQRGA